VTVKRWDKNLLWIVRKMPSILLIDSQKFLGSNIASSVSNLLRLHFHLGNFLQFSSKWAFYFKIEILNLFLCCDVLFDLVCVCFNTLQTVFVWDGLIYCVCVGSSIFWFPKCNWPFSSYLLTFQEQTWGIHIGKND